MCNNMVGPCYILIGRDRAVCHSNSDTIDTNAEAMLINAA